jgi:APA family basic amino acid/polyamine antiporter
LTTLARTLGFRDLLLLVIGAVIGSGIFLVPGAILRQVDGSVGLAMLVWLVGGIVTLLGALTYGELTAMKPQAGGIYVFIRDCFGPLPAFLYGWTLFFVIATGATATLSVAFSKYFGEIVPLSPAGGKIVSLGMIAVIAAINVRGTRRSADVQNISTLIKAGAVVLMSAGLLVMGRNYHALSASLFPAKITGALLSQAGMAMIGALWAYEAWQFATFSAGEVIEPQKNYPRAFLGGILFLIALYIVANLAYIAALGPTEVAATDTIAATSVSRVLSPALAKLVALAIMVSTFSAANSIQLTAPRVYYAMAADGLFFKKLSEVHPKFRTPALAIVIGAVWSAALALSGTFQKLFTYVIFSGWIFYGLAAACVFVYRKREPETARPYRVPGYPWTPLLFVLAAAALVVNTIYSTFFAKNSTASPVEAAVGIGVIAAGLPAYFVWRGKKGKEIGPTDEHR